MFEMFVLLINPHSFCFATCFLFTFMSEALLHRGLRHTIFYIAYLRICLGNLLEEFGSRICRRNFVVRNCRGFLPWVFCMCWGILFCICEQILFIWKQTFFICEQNFLICEIFFINSFSFCYFRGSYGPPDGANLLASKIEAQY